MAYLNSFGRKCQVGWGYNAKNGSFIHNIKINNFETLPMTSIFSDTKFFDFNCFTFSYFICNLYNVFYHYKTGFFESLITNNQNAYKLMDFWIENHEISGFISNVWCRSKKTTATKSDNYPPETTHFVDWVYFGLEMWIIFDKKNNHLFEIDEDGEFLNKIWRKKQKLTNQQKNVVCSVLIFSSNPENTECKKMTMNEILELSNNFQSGQRFDYEIPIYYRRSKLTENSYFLDDGNYDTRLKILANQLFDIYWLKKILENKTTMPVCLNKTSVFKDIYPEIKNRKNSNFWSEKMTNLWNHKIDQCFEIIGGSEITEAEFFWDSLFDQLNKMVEESRTESMNVPSINSQLLLILKDDIELMEELSEETFGETEIIIMNKNHFRSLHWEMVLRLKMGIFLSNNHFEPYVKNTNLDKKVLIGFASHQNQFTKKIIGTSELFVFHCPMECSKVDRQWICVDCGQFFKVGSSVDEVGCGCGTFHITNLKFECFDSKHPKTFSFWPKTNSSSVSLSPKSFKS